MAQEADSLAEKSGDVLRELAGHQGLAYRKYGEALEKFGSGEINAGELFKTAGDLYLKEAGRISASVFEAGAEVFKWTLGTAGLKIVEESTAHPHPKSAVRK